MNDELRGVEELMEEDGFVNFYAVLEITPETSPEEIQDIINALYQEAQNHRDHRVAARRREYQILLDILPQARTILTDKVRRRRYDAYCNAVSMQLPRMPYSDFFNDLMREKEAPDARSDILTVRDLSRLRGAEPAANGTTATAPPPVIQPPVQEVAPSTPAPAVPVAAPAAPPAEVPTSPVGAEMFPLQTIIGGVCVLVGLLASLPTLAGVPIFLAVPLALIGAGVTGYVFGMTVESEAEVVTA